VTVADAIHHVVDERSMPPWPADPDYRHFVGEAYLDSTEIAMIHQWIDYGLYYGDETIEPEPPIFPPQGSLLEQIDFTVAIEPYTLQSNVDEYRWFVIENPFDVPVYISQIEVFPGLEQVVHHADLFYDLSGTSLANDDADPLSGFNSSTGWPNNDYYINAWQPGANIVKYPQNWGIEIPPEADFVVEIHYGPDGIGLTDSTIMNLQFITNPVDVRPIKAAWLLSDTAPMLIDGPLVIPANEVVTFHQVSAPLPNDLSIVSICPHMHGLGKSYRVWFESPTGDSIPLINIPQWDFHWQKYYTFQQIQKIPAGSVMKSEGVYDNTVDNHDNPNDPPITVSKGPYTEDEMFLCYFIYTDYEEGDENIIMDSTLLEPPTEITMATEEDTMVVDTTMTSIGIYDHTLWRISPNPVKNQFVLEGSSLASTLHFYIKNTSGQIVQQKRQSNATSTWHTVFDIQSLASGVYFLEWWDGTTQHTLKFVKH